MLLDYNSTPNKNQIFANDINHELADIAYYQKLIQGKQQNVEKLSAIQEKANIVLGLTEEVASEIADTNERYLASFQTRLDEIILNCSSSTSSDPRNQHTEASSIAYDDIEEALGNEVESAKPSSSTTVDENNEIICSSQSGFSSTSPISAEEKPELTPLEDSSLSDEDGNQDDNNSDKEGGGSKVDIFPTSPPDNGDGAADIEPTDKSANSPPLSNPHWRVLMLPLSLLMTTIPLVMKMAILMVMTKMTEEAWQKPTPLIQKMMEMAEQKQNSLLHPPMRVHQLPPLK